QARCRRVPARALGLPRDLLPRLRPDAARRRGRAPLLACRALQPPRPLDRRPPPPLGRLLPRVPRRLRAAGRSRRPACDPREHGADGRGSVAAPAVGERLRLAADVGGTFTDVLALDEAGRVHASKVLSTPPDYDVAVVAAVRALDADVVSVVHGTTVATNAVLE